MAKKIDKIKARCERERAKVIAIVDTIRNMTGTFTAEGLRRVYYELAKEHHAQSNLIYSYDTFKDGQTASQIVENCLRSMRGSICSLLPINHRDELLLCAFAIRDAWDSIEEGRKQPSDEGMKTAFAKRGVMKWWPVFGLANHWSNDLIWWVDLEVIGIK